jgi:hypothetical protein
MKQYYEEDTAKYSVCVMWRCKFELLICSADNDGVKIGGMEVAKEENICC